MATLLSEPRPRVVTPRSAGFGGRRAVQLAAGPFHISALVGDTRSCLGLLVADGLVKAEVSAGRAHVACLLGAGDLVRPWEMADISLTGCAEWQALGRARIVRLERSPAPGSAVPGGTLETLLAHAARTSHWLLASSVIMSSPSISERLLLLFALYGERWGKVTPDGIRIELPLTHELLGKLCGARRPTVTLAVNSLMRDGLLSRVSHRVWLLHQQPELSSAFPCWPAYAPALGFGADGGGSVPARVA